MGKSRLCSQHKGLFKIGYIIRIAKFHRLAEAWVLMFSLSVSLS